MSQRSANQIQSEITRSRILKATADLLVGKGYRSTSIQNITEKTGVTKGAVYHHFENKSALVLSLVNSVRSSWSRDVGRPTLGESGARNRLRSLIARHTELVEKDPGMCIVMSSLMVEIDALDDPVAAAVRAVYADLTGFIVRVLDHGVQTGELAAETDVNSAAFIVTGMIRWIGCSPLYSFMEIDRSAAESLLQDLLQKAL